MKLTIAYEGTPAAVDPTRVSPALLVAATLNEALALAHPASKERRP